MFYSLQGSAIRISVLKFLFHFNTYPEPRLFEQLYASFSISSKLLHYIDPIFFNYHLKE